MNSSWLIPHGFQTKDQNVDTNISFGKELLIKNDTESYADDAFTNYSPELLYFGAVVIAVFAIFGILGNVISILALYRCKKLWNPTTAFIVNLCFAELIFCCTTLPQSSVIFIERKWNHGENVCKMFAFMKYINSPVSIFTVLAIAVNRYIMILHRKVYSKVYSKGMIIAFVCIIWLIPFVIMLPSLLEFWGKFGYDPKVSDCVMMDLYGKSPKTFLYVTIYLVPAIFFIACYLRIYFYVRKTSKQVLKHSVKSGSICGIPENYKHCKDIKAFRLLKVLLLMFVLYILCYFPLALVKIYRKEKELHVLNVFGYILFFLSAVINPFIYILLGKEYRNAYKNLWCCGPKTENLSSQSSVSFRRDTIKQSSIKD